MNIQGKKVSQEGRAVTSGFSELSPAVNSLVDAVTVANNYPTGAVLFSEAEPTRGIYFVRRGRVKLSVCARDGKTLILHIAGAGELMGVAAVLSQHDYEATAETLERSEERRVGKEGRCGWWAYGCKKKCIACGEMCK